MSHDSKKVAMISGITGQSGEYLAKFLLEKIIGVWACTAAAQPILFQN